MMRAYGSGELQTSLLRQLHRDSNATQKTLAEALGVTRKRVSGAASALIARGYVNRLAWGMYELTDAGRTVVESGGRVRGGPADCMAMVLTRSARDGFRDRLWRSIRLRGVFTLQDLVADATNGEADPMDRAQRFVRYLRSAGYIVELRGRARGTVRWSNGFKRFRLVKNTGPRAPICREKYGVLHDPNTGEDVPCSRS